MPILATYRNGVYDFFLLLHIVCAIIGFGAVFLNGLYAQEIKKRPGPEGVVVLALAKMCNLICEMVAGGPPVGGPPP